MVRQKTTGDIGDATITVTIESDDEPLANRIYADLVGRADELKQMVEEDVPQEETMPPMTADWASYLNDRGDLE